MPREKLQIIRITWKRLLGALRMLVRSEQGPKAVAFAVTLVLLMIAINGLNVVNSFVGRYFFSAIENRDVAVFQRQTLYYILVFVASSVVLVFYRFTEERLGILWREQLTRRLTEAYLKDRTYYRLDSATGVANPDQRISEDVRAFTTTTLSFVLLIVNGTLTAISFSGVLWTISPLLFGVAVAYAVVGSVLTIYLGKPLIRLNYNQLDMEANFRSDLIHVRENSESIAMAHREGRFRAKLNRRLDALTANFRRLIRINRNLGFFTNGYNYFIQIIPALIIAPMFIMGTKEFGVITQSTMAFATLVGAFSLIVTQFQSISAFTAVVARLHTLSD
ncbi:MAG: ABC transporter ATP-binding protein/permease, partial [Luteolibacter sp.]